MNNRGTITNVHLNHYIPITVLQVSFKNVLKYFIYKFCLNDYHSSSMGIFCLLFLKHVCRSHRNIYFFMSEQTSMKKDRLCCRSHIKSYFISTSLILNHSGYKKHALEFRILHTESFLLGRWHLSKEQS